jgi:hypothetical protein
MSCNSWCIYTKFKKIKKWVFKDVKDAWEASVNGLPYWWDSSRQKPLNILFSSYHYIYIFFTWIHTVYEPKAPNKVKIMSLSVLSTGSNDNI